MAASPSAHLLLPVLGDGAQLGCLCDVKAAGGQSYFRLNDDKVRTGAVAEWGGGRAPLHGILCQGRRACTDAVHKGGRPLQARPLPPIPPVQVLAWLRLKVEQCKAAMQASPAAAFRWVGGQAGQSALAKSFVQAVGPLVACLPACP